MLNIKDLRPYLGKLNWELRRIKLAIAVSTDKDSGEVVRVQVIPSQEWTVTCDGCGNKFFCKHEQYPKCPKCGIVEVVT